MPRRLFLIILDSLGVGAMPDAADYGDASCNTLGNLSRAVHGLKLPNLGRFGLGNIINIEGVPPVGNGALGSWGKAAIASKGKDTTIGHLEIAGLILDKPFPVYPKGFPKNLIDEFCRATGFTGVLGNKAASGTEIIKELGEEHIKTGLPIVYTSADSVFQIAAHEDRIPPKELWRICNETKKILRPPNNLSRVIARPFIGSAGSFTRTANRRDFVIDPPGKTLLDFLKGAGHKVYGIGKIEDIFNGHGLTKSVHTKDNLDGIRNIIEAVGQEGEGLIFTNLVDFDMKYGHRNDEAGYAAALEEFDSYLPGIMAGFLDDDVLIITADHGCDPTYKASTDHSREYVPVLIYGKALKGGLDIGTRDTLADIGQTVAEFFGIAPLKNGSSFWGRSSL